MADFLGNDIFLIPILSLFTCLAFTRFYFLSFLLFASLVWQTYAYYACTLALLHSLESIGRIFCSFACLQLGPSQVIF